MLKIHSLEQYQLEYKKSIENPELFWEGIAKSFEWKKKWDKVLDWNFDEPNIKWFDGGQLNITENCLDRHLDSIGDKVAFHWIPNNISEERRKISYRELHAEVCKFSTVLVRNGIKKAIGYASTCLWF